MKNAIKAKTSCIEIKVVPPAAHILHEEFIHTKHSYQFYSLQNSEEGNITISEITWPKASVKEQLLACFLCFKGNTVIPFSFTTMRFLIFYYITSKEKKNFNL